MTRSGRSRAAEKLERCASGSCGSESRNQQPHNPAPEMPLQTRQAHEEFVPFFGRSVDVPHRSEHTSSKKQKKN